MGLQIDFRPGAVVVRSGNERLSCRIGLRALAIGLALLVLCLMLGAVALATGTYPVSLAGVADALSGNGEEMVRTVVTEWRLPRVMLALLLGAALGMSGAIFQSLTRNPLGSPDIIGFAAGSHSGALVVILLFSGGYYETAAGAIAGGMGTALAVYLLAWRGGVQGFRLIVVGIGISAMLGALNAWMIRKADLQVAMSAAVWSAGSLNGLGAGQLLPAALALCLIVPPALLLSRPMRQLELGEDAALASGIPVHAVRVCLMALGVALTATVTASAGPIAFVALAAPQIARRLTRSAGVTLLPSALAGSLLLLSADQAAQHAFATQLPVGVMTVSIGGLYFLWLIVRQGRI